MAQIIHLEEVSSTNEYLAELLRHGKPEEGCCVWANRQTAGKGQSGNVWESEDGQNLTFSLVLHPDDLEANRQFIVSQLVSVAIIDALKDFGIENLRIKWANDIYAGDKKLVGILIENTLTGSRVQSCIIGIGVNINQQTFCSDAPNPVSLYQLTGKKYDIQHILTAILSQIFARYTQLVQQEEHLIVEEYLQNLYGKDRFLTYKKGEKHFEARVKTVCQSGYLTLETRKGKEERFAFREVKLIV